MTTRTDKTCLDIVSCNIEMDKHLEERVVPFLDSQNWNLALLQEVFADDMSLLEEATDATGVHAVQATVLTPNRWEISQRGEFGVAVLSKLPIKSVKQHIYDMPDEYEAPDAIPEFLDGYPNSQRRVLLVVEVETDTGVVPVATTHFRRSAKGKATASQARALDEVLDFAEEYPTLAIAGDWNIPRGNEHYQRLTQEFTDNIPPEYQGSLDPELHGVGHLDLMVDYVWTKGDVIARGVQLHTGVSDHRAITAQLCYTR